MPPLSARFPTVGSMSSQYIALRLRFVYHWSLRPMKSASLISPDSASCHEFPYRSVPFSSQSMIAGVYGSSSVRPY